jgi:hypothetical protein
MDNAVRKSTIAWFATVVGACAMALAAPEESAVMGYLHAPVAVKRAGQMTVPLPEALPAARTLAIVAFQRHQRSEVQSWIDGLRLRDGAIAWVKMPVLSDPGNDRERKRIEDRILARHQESGDSARVVTLFTDRDEFIRAARLSGAEHASVLVLDRDGRVLARAEGEYNEAKAQALRETLLAQGD